MRAGINDRDPLWLLVDMARPRNLYVACVGADEYAVGRRYDRCRQVLFRGSAAESSRWMAALPPERR
jgi:hypothetical protein